MWSAYSLRKRWNAVKDEAAPWWAECSKEAYANGIVDAVESLRNWQAFRTGKRKGRRVGFPRFRKKAKDRPRCQYTTGVLRVVGPRAARRDEAREPPGKGGGMSAIEHSVATVPGHDPGRCCPW